MARKAYVVTSMKQRLVVRAYNRIFPTVRVRWTIIGETFFVWPADEQELGFIEQTASQFLLKIKEVEQREQKKVSSRSNGVLFPIPENGRQAGPPVIVSLIHESKRHTRKFEPPLMFETAVKKQRGGQSKRPSNDEFLKSLRERGVGGTASRYGVSVLTVKKLWAKVVPGAKALIPDGRKAR